MQTQTVTLAKAKTHLSALVEQAEMGEEIWITRHGRVAARIVGVASERRVISANEIRAFQKKLPHSKTTSAKILRKLRDEGY